MEQARAADLEREQVSVLDASTCWSVGIPAHDVEGVLTMLFGENFDSVPIEHDASRIVVSGRSGCFRSAEFFNLLDRLGNDVRVLVRPRIDCAQALDDVFHVSFFLMSPRSDSNRRGVVSLVYKTSAVDR